MNNSKIYIGADHRGYELKEKIFQWLVDKEYRVEDFGAYEYKKDDNYTEFATKVASVVGDEEDARGILFCGSGVGVDVVANKFDGVRSSIGKEPAQVRAGRTDDDMNVLVIAADFTSEKETKDMVDVFLTTRFSGKDRHERRLKEIQEIEANN